MNDKVLSSLGLAKKAGKKPVESIGCANCQTTYTMDQFSDAIGASFYISCIAVFDRGFHNMIIKHLNESGANLSLQEV